MLPLSEQSDQKLMKQYLDGNHKAFNILYERYKGKIYAYLNKRLSNESDVAEVYQNVFMKFHKSRNKYNENYLPAQWFFVIARSELLDFCKKKRISTVPIDGFEPISTEQTNNDSLEITDLSSLNKMERTAIEMRFLSELEYKDMSEKLGLTQSNIRKIVSRALAKLRGTLAKN